MNKFFIAILTLSTLSAKPCSEGGCPIQMVERLREEKQAARKNAALVTQQEEEEQLPYDGEDMDEAIDSRLLLS